MQITDLAKEQALAPLLRQAFRPMFLFGAVYSVIAMALWGLALSGMVELRPYYNVMFWHQHEMVFGFVAAIIVGFLLTAVQNWTGMRATHGKTLFILTAVWLAGRLLMLFGGGLPQWLVALVDLAFLPLAAILFGVIVIKAGQTRNLFFVPVLLLLTLCNALMHAGVIWGQFQFIQHGSLNAIWLITLIMAIVSGRVLPMFTANGTGTPRVNPAPLLDKLALGSLWLIFVLHFFLLTSYIPHWALATLFAFAAVVNLIRLVRVRFWVTFKVPLLWSLHIAVAFIPLGLALFALRYAGFSVTVSTGVHALTAGAMGVMILAMMARVSLGHTGRLLQPKAVMSVAFVLVILAALLRVFAGWLLPGFPLTWYNVAIGAWVVSYLLYIIVYFPVLTAPREDGRPG
ncbi:NnrS family protein [Aliidiomarina haloalkalitolerans]|uniref:NnrS family protein n=1 Tax=Aliidiomarina haloalkalitolerans TaxID=859059 RepID=A0A432VVV1_9GAMM|nr:NnrS family protein [Aliidiomarina haloalkalitolerans]RUO20717.1 NnrS family protein [Aliidiomarina haloalkalitolerans]